LVYGESGKSLRLIFRYDDFSASREQSYFPIDQAAFELFERLHFPLVVGVTPFMSDDVNNPDCQVMHYFAQDQRRCRLLAKGLNCGWQLALHGYRHMRVSKQIRSEFEGQSANLQRNMIEKGRDAVSTIFPDTPLQVFIPPWNSFDLTTLISVADAGFSVICAGSNTRPDKYEGVTVVPSLMTIKQFIGFCRNFPILTLNKLLGDTCLVVTLHSYELMGGAEHYAVSFDDFSSVLGSVKRSGIPVAVFDPNEDYTCFQVEKYFSFKVHRFAAAESFPARLLREIILNNPVEDS
jgi:hypothetical protein